MPDTPLNTPSPEPFAAPYATIFCLAKKELFRRGLSRTVEVRDLAHTIILTAAETFDGARDVPLVAYAHQPVNIQRAIEATLYAEDKVKVSLCRQCHRRSRDCSCGSRERTGRLLPKSGLCPAGTGMRAPDPDSLTLLITEELHLAVTLMLPRLIIWERQLVPSDHELWHSLISGDHQMATLIRVTHTPRRAVKTRAIHLIASAARALRVPCAQLTAAIQAVSQPRPPIQPSVVVCGTHPDPDVLRPPLGNGPRRKGLLEAALRGDATAHTQLRTRYHLTCWTRDREEIL